MRQLRSSRRAPSPPTSPPGPSHSHAEHAIEEEPVYDLDGPSKREQDDYGEPIVAVVIESSQCRREGCEAEQRQRHFYTMADCSSTRSLDAAYNDWHTNAPPSEELDGHDYAEFVWDADTEIEPEMDPIIHVTYDGRRVCSFHVTETHTETDDRGGECYGQPLDPVY